MKKENVVLQLEDNLTIIIKGKYSKSEEPKYYPIDEAHDGSAAEFDLDNIELLEGSLLDYSNYIEQLLYKTPNLILSDHFSELAILKLEEDV